MRIQCDATRFADVALKLGNSLTGIDAGDGGEVDLVRAVPEVGDDVGSGKRRVRCAAVRERVVARASGQDVGSGAAGRSLPPLPEIWSLPDVPVTASFPGLPKMSAPALCPCSPAALIAVAPQLWLTASPSWSRPESRAAKGGEIFFRLHRPARLRMPGRTSRSVAQASRSRQPGLLWNARSSGLFSQDHHAPRARRRPPSPCPA